MRIQLNNRDYIEINGNSLTSNLKSVIEGVESKEYNAAIDGIESLVLALHCNGVNLLTPDIKGAIELAVESVAREFE